MTQIYLLPYYANSENLEDNRHATAHESVIRFFDQGLSIELSEMNSLVEDRYCFQLKCAKCEIEGNLVKQAMIHHHKKPHYWKHVQFKLAKEHEVIRINLEPVDEEDYEKCIKGFMHVCKDILDFEQEENKIEEDLIEHFFNEKIEELEPFRNYLIAKIKNAFEKGRILDDADKPIDASKLEEFKSEKHLLPFFGW
jgi:hypothetical protein